MPLHFLRSPTAWQALGQARGRVEFVETRHSWVFLCGSRVLKLKKPVRERVLVEVRDACRRLGRPIVLLHDPVFAPGLDPFAATCDLVLDLTADDTEAPTIVAAIDDLSQGQS